MSELKSSVFTGSDLTFSRAICVDRLENAGTDRIHYFTVMPPSTFATLGMVNGGYLNAVSVNACRNFLDTITEPGAYPDIINSSFQFITRTLVGNLTIGCELIHRSKSLCVIQIRLFQSGKDGRPQHATDPTAVGILTWGEFAKERGISADIESIALFDLPPRERCLSLTDDPYVNALPLFSTFRMLGRKEPDKWWGQGAGGFTRDMWLAMKPGENIDQFNLTFLADMGLQPVMSQEEGQYYDWAVTTLTLQIEYKRPIPKDLEWIHARTITHMCRNGRYDMDLFLLDAAHEIIALAHHVVYVRPARLPPGLKRPVPKI